MVFRLSKYFKKLSSRRVFLVAIAVTTSLVLLFDFLGTKAAPQDSISAPVVQSVVIEEKIIPPGLPKRLVISSIGVDVVIDYVGLTADGAMEVEPSSKVANWYMLGPRPGDKGSAVIAGHYGWDENGDAAIFNNISKLVKGDELSVIDQEGQSITFVVREIREYNPESDASDVFESNDVASHLNLITCNGVWENDKQSYSNRLVVFTDKKL